MTLRPAASDDVEPIAALHADSWRRNYRGAFSDAFLDGDVYADRLAVWSDRLTGPTAGQSTIVAEREGEFVGFVYTIFAVDPQYGALVENLHVTHAHKRGGIGTDLMAAAAAAVIGHDPASGVYLWVLVQNTAAQAFYTARGGERSGPEPRRSPAGDPVSSYRMAWRDPSALLLRS